MKSIRGRILAWHIGKRSDKDYLKLWKLLSPFPLTMCYTDDWGSYSKYIPEEMHRFAFQKTKPFTIMLLECTLRDSIIMLVLKG